MPWQAIRRKQNSLTLNAASTKTSSDLGRGMVLREVILRLSGTITYANAAHNTPSTLGRGGEWSVIDKVDLVVNGTDTIRSFQGWQLPMLNKLMYGSAPRSSPELGDATQTAVKIDSTVVIPIWMPLAAKPMDTALDTSKLQGLKLEVTTNALLGINKTNGPQSFALTLEVSTVECYGMQFVGSDCRMWQIQAAAGTNSALQVSLPPVALYRGLLVNCADGSASTSTDKSPSTFTTGAALGITNLKVKSGQHIFHDMSVQAQSDWQRIRTGWMDQKVQSVAASAALNLVNPFYLRQTKSALADAEAWQFVDFVQDGYLGEGIDSVGLSELIAEFDCTLSSGIITVIPIAIFPNRGMRQAA